MVAVRATRLVGQVIRKAIPRGAATRATLSIGASADHASGEPVRVTRLVGQVISEVPAVVGVTRETLSVGASADHASAQPVLATRLVGQVISKNKIVAAVTRETLSVGASAAHLTTQPVRLTRLVGQALSRLKALPVVPLPLASNQDFFLHNWADGIEMTTTWSTDVTSSTTTAAEERCGLVSRPIRTITLRWTKNTLTELDRIMVLLRRFTRERFQLPLFQDTTPLGGTVIQNTTILPMDTTQARFAPGVRVAIFEIDYALHFTGKVYYRQIVNMQSDHLEVDSPLEVGVDVPPSVGGSSIMVVPLMDMEKALRGITGKFENGRLIDVTLTATEVQGPSALSPWSADITPGYNQFDGYPIWRDHPDWSDGVEFEWDHPGEAIDLGRGAAIYLGADRPRYVLNIPLSGERAFANRIIKFLDSRRGRLRPWWQLDEEHFWTTQAIQASGDFIDITPLGSFADFSDKMEFIGLEMADGTYYVRPVVSVVDNGTNWRLTVSPQLPAGLSAANVLQTARARLVRNVSDSYTERWDTTNVFRLSLQTIQVLNEGESAP